MCPDVLSMSYQWQISMWTWKFRVAGLIQAKNLSRVLSAEKLLQTNLTWELTSKRILKRSRSFARGATKPSHWKVISTNTKKVLVSRSEDNIREDAWKVTYDFVWTLRERNTLTWKSLYSIRYSGGKNPISLATCVSLKLLLFGLLRTPYKPNCFLSKAEYHWCILHHSPSAFAGRWLIWRFPSDRL